MADTKAGGVFVEIGGRNEKLRAAYREAEAVTRSSLGAMGRQAAAFSTRFASALGIGVAGGAAGLFGATIKAAVNFRAALVQLGTQAATSGRPFKEVQRIVDETADGMGRLTGTTRSQIAQITTWAIRAKIATSELKAFAQEVAAFAALRGLDPVSVARTVAGTQISGGGLPAEFGIRTAANALPPDVIAAFRRHAKKDVEIVPPTGVPGGLFKRIGAKVETGLESFGEFIEEGFRAGADLIGRLAAEGTGGPFKRLPAALEAQIDRAPLSDEQRAFLRNKIRTGGRPGLGFEALEFIGSTIDDLIGGGGAPARALQPLLQSNVPKALRDVFDAGSNEDIAEFFQAKEQQATDLTGVGAEGRRRAGFTGQGPPLALEDQMPIVRELKIVTEKLDEIKTTIDEGGRVF